MSIDQALNRFRGLAIQCDLKPDKSYSVKGNIIRYVSIGKYKRVLSPLFVKAGLEFGFNIVKVEDLPLVTRITVNFMFTDVATGEFEEETIIADGSNTQPDKGIPTAMSYAIRILLSNKFMLEDGIDYEEGESITDALERISVPESPVEQKVESVKTIQSNEEVRNPSKTDDDGKAVSKDVPTEDKPSKAVKLTPMEMSAAKKCMSVIDDAYAAGTVVEDTYLKAKEIFDNLSSTADVTALMQIKSEIPIKNAKEGF